MKYFFLSLLLLLSIDAKYLSNNSCSECHEKIYDEYQSSMHSKSFFSDELHQKVANAANKNKYDCAECHMPAANNLKDLISGKARPDSHNITHTDGVSCYFCHTIAYVKSGHKHYINVKAKQASGFKPTLYGRLNNPDDSNKHDSLNNPLYAKNVCIGCHSFKLNDYNTTIFKAIKSGEDSLSCIKCHMPKVAGGNEKMNGRNRHSHTSHKFLGIHDKEFAKKGLDINITVDGNTLNVLLKNKMPHPLIIQPARAKYFHIVVKRGDKIIWQNYKKSPQEDKKAYFAHFFKKDNKESIIPSDATSGKVHNIEANKSKILKYTIPNLKKGDLIEVDYFVQYAKTDCTKAIKLKDKSFLTPNLIKKVTKVVK